MDSQRGTASAIAAEGLRVALELDWRVASLRHFHPASRAAGAFAGVVGEALGGTLPEPLRAVEIEHPVNGARSLLAWRSLTETLLLTRSAAAFTDLEQRLSSVMDGCMVDQTGGIRVIRVEGARSAELLVRLGAPTVIAAAGEARSGRLAELQVLSASVRAGEWLLLVERVYADHLLAWIRATAADF